MKLSQRVEAQPPTTDKNGSSLSEGVRKAWPLTRNENKNSRRDLAPSRIGVWGAAPQATIPSHYSKKGQLSIFQ